MTHNPLLKIASGLGLDPTTRYAPKPPTIKTPNPVQFQDLPSKPIPDLNDDQEIIIALFLSLYSYIFESTKIEFQTNSSYRYQKYGLVRSISTGNLKDSVAIEFARQVQSYSPVNNDIGIFDESLVKKLTTRMVLDNHKYKTIIDLVAAVFGKGDNYQVDYEDPKTFFIPDYFGVLREIGCPVLNVISNKPTTPRAGIFPAATPFLKMMSVSLAIFDNISDVQSHSVTLFDVCAFSARPLGLDAYKEKVAKVSIVNVMANILKDARLSCKSLSEHWRTNSSCYLAFNGLAISVYDDPYFNKLIRDIKDYKKKELSETPIPIGYDILSIQCYYHGSEVSSYSSNNGDVYVNKNILVVAAEAADSNKDPNPEAQLKDDQTDKADKAVQDRESQGAAPDTTDTATTDDPDLSDSEDPNTDQTDDGFGGDDDGTGDTGNNDIAQQQDTAGAAPADTDPALPLDQTGEGAGEALYRLAVLNLSSKLVEEPGEMDVKKVEDLRQFVETWMFVLPIDATYDQVKKLGLSSLLKSLAPQPKKDEGAENNG